MSHAVYLGLLIGISGLIRPCTRGVVMHAHGGRHKSALGILIAAVAGFSLLFTATAQAIVITTNDTPTLATVIATPGTVIGSGQAVTYPCVVDDPATPTFDETNCPTGISDSPIGGFPTEGSTYGIFTTGNAAFADDPNTAGNTGEGWFTTNPAMGAKVYDWNTYRFDLAAATAGCLAFDFKFYSDEFPEFVGSQFNDAFIAQLGSPAVTVDPTTGAINAPGNFAAGAGDMISVNESGPSATSEAAALGTTYDGATALLTARVPVTPGATNSLFLTLFDQGDSAYDSAAFVDNVRYETIDPKKCKSLALDPAEGTIGGSLIPGNPPKLTKDLEKLKFPISCDLPPGPVSCDFSAVASFLPTQGRVMSARAEAALAGVPLTKVGTATVPPDSNGVIVMKVTNKGEDAIKAAIKKPGKLKKKAKALLAKAKILRSQGKIAEAKKLESKAAALIKRAKKLARKPLGVIKTTVTNPDNGISQSFKTTLKRP
jgi:hypothetical protein